MSSSLDHTPDHRTHRVCLGGVPLLLSGDEQVIAATLERYARWLEAPARREPWQVHFARRAEAWRGVALQELEDGSRIFGDERCRGRLRPAERALEAELCAEALADGRRLADALDLLCRNVVTWAHLAAGHVALHAAAVADRGKAWIFTGPSGAGKSTIAGLLEADGAGRLADDQVLLEAVNGTTYLIPAPDWHREVANGAVDARPLPVEGVFALRHGPRRIDLLGPGAALALLSAGVRLAPASYDPLVAGARVMEGLRGRVGLLTFVRERGTLDWLHRCWPERHTCRGATSRRSSNPEKML